MVQIEWNCVLHDCIFVRIHWGFPVVQSHQRRMIVRSGTLVILMFRLENSCLSEYQVYMYVYIWQHWYCFVYYYSYHLHFFVCFLIETANNMNHMNNSFNKCVASVWIRLILFWPENLGRLGNTNTVYNLLTSLVWNQITNTAFSLNVIFALSIYNEFLLATLLWCNEL